RDQVRGRRSGEVGRPRSIFPWFQERAPAGSAGARTARSPHGWSPSSGLYPRSGENAGQGYGGLRYKDVAITADARPGGRGGAGPVRGLLGGKAPTGRLS